MATKEELNSVLNAKTINDVYSADVAEEANRIAEISHVNKSTLVGRTINDVFAGLEGQEVKVDNAGEVETLGETIVRVTENVPGIGSIFNPATTINRSTPSVNGNLLNFDSDAFNALTDSDLEDAFRVFDPVGGDSATSIADVISATAGFVTAAVLGNVQYGATSMEAVKAMTADAAAKEAALAASVLESVASSIFDAVNKQAEVAAVQATYGAKEADIGECIKQASSVPSLNKDAPKLENVDNETGNKSFLARVNEVVNAVDTSLAQIEKEINAGLNEITSAFGDLATDFQNFLGGTRITTGGGILQNIYEDLTREASSAINKLVFPNTGDVLEDQELSDLVTKLNSGTPEDLVAVSTTIARRTNSNSAEMQAVIEDVLAQGDPRSIDQFIDDITSRAIATGIDQDEIDFISDRIKETEAAVLELNTTISGSVVKLQNAYYQEDYDLTENIQKFKGSATAFDAFTYIDSKEELGAEIKNIIRDVSEVIVHATETYTNANIGCEEIHVEHNDKGFDGIQYHYVIRRDGRLQRGRPSEKAAEASAVNSHNTRCIDIALVGGLNCPSGTENPIEYRSPQSFTRAQMNTLEAFLEAFYRRYPGGQVMGHNDISDLDEDPYFDVIEYANTLFRKVNVYTDPLTETAFASATLITKEPQ